MATLPATGSVDIAQGVEYRQLPSLTWGIDKETNRIYGTADRLEAVQQAVEIILNTERFRWQIYRPYSGVRLLDLVGQDPGFVGMELQRRIREALSMDDRVQSISDFSYTVNGDSMEVSFRVHTVYGVTDPLTLEVRA